MELTRKKSGPSWSAVNFQRPFTQDGLGQCHAIFLKHRRNRSVSSTFNGSSRSILRINQWRVQAEGKQRYNESPVTWARVMSQYNRRKGLRTLVNCLSLDKFWLYQKFYKQTIKHFSFYSVDNKHTLCLSLYVLLEIKLSIFWNQRSIILRI